MKLILIRHGDAGAYTLPDHERNLSELGKAQATQTGQWLQRYVADNIEAGIKPIQFIVSPYNRARQTLETILGQTTFKAPNVTICDAITPDDNPSLAVLNLSELISDKIVLEDGYLVVVCHMNIIAQIASILTARSEHGFGLAEARVYELPFLGAGDAYQIDGFVPNVD